MTKKLKDSVMDELLLKSFGKHIKELRAKQSMSQEDLGLKADLDRTYISGIERGLRNVSLLNIIRISKALNISLQELMNFEMSGNNE